MEEVRDAHFRAEEAGPGEHNIKGRAQGTRECFANTGNTAHTTSGVSRACRILRRASDKTDRTAGSARGRGGRSSHRARSPENGSCIIACLLKNLLSFPDRRRDPHYPFGRRGRSGGAICHSWNTKTTSLLLI